MRLTRRDLVLMVVGALIVGVAWIGMAYVLRTALR